VSHFLGLIPELIAVWKCLLKFAHLLPHLNDTHNQKMRSKTAYHVCRGISSSSYYDARFLAESRHMHKEPLKLRATVDICELKMLCISIAAARHTFSHSEGILGTALYSKDNN
jgi:hypothetical protein